MCFKIQRMWPSGLLWDSDRSQLGLRSIAQDALVVPENREGVLPDGKATVVEMPQQYDNRSGCRVQSVGFIREAKSSKRH